MTIGVLDLAIITDQLLQQLRDARTNTRLWTEEPTPPIGSPVFDPVTPPGDLTPDVPFDIYFTGMPPDQARALSGECKVSLYLFHVAPDKTYRNVYPAEPYTPPVVPPGQPVPPAPPNRARLTKHQPMALTLYYLLSAHSESYIQEQQAMSIALKCFHDRPSTTAIVPLQARRSHFTLTLEPESLDEIGRLWQSFALSLRLSAVYRASVVFLEPEPDPTPRPLPVKKWSVSAYPQFLVARADLDATGLVTVRGHRFRSEGLKISLDDHLLTTIQEPDRPPPLPPAPGQPAPPPPPPRMPALDEAVVDSDTQLRVQLATPRDKGLARLGVRIPSEPVEAIFTVRIPEDLP